LSQEDFRNRIFLDAILHHFYKETKMKPTTISIDNVQYVRDDSVSTSVPALDGMEYKIFRTFSAGVFAGYLAKKWGKEYVVKQARRLWYWQGAASLSQLAQSGTTKPNGCKFPETVDEILLLEVIEILNVTEKAKKSIDSVPVWIA
jgi:hypothetical protein